MGMNIEKNNVHKIIKPISNVLMYFKFEDKASNTGTLNIEK